MNKNGKIIEINFALNLCKRLVLPVAYTDGLSFSWKHDFKWWFQGIICKFNIWGILNVIISNIKLILIGWTAGCPNSTSHKGSISGMHHVKRRRRGGGGNGHGTDQPTDRLNKIYLEDDDGRQGCYRNSEFGILGIYYRLKYRALVLRERFPKERASDCVIVGRSNGFGLYWVPSCTAHRLREMWILSWKK